MKACTARRWFAAMALAAVPVAGRAAELSWDAGVTGGAGGGATTAESNEWKTAGAASVWWDGGANVAWANGNDATFGGIAGTVRLGSAISAGTLKFNTVGYVIDLRNQAVAPQNLTLTGLSGSAATIRASHTAANGSANLTLSMAADTVWGGAIGSGGDRMGVTVNGGKSLTVATVTRNGGAYQQTLTITGSGTKLALSGTGSTYAGNFVTVNAGATFNLGSNGNFSARQITSS